MKILFLSSWYPYPPNNGSKLRIFNLLRGLAQQHQVTLLTFADQPDIDFEAPELRSICHEVQIVPWKPYNPHSLRARTGYLSMAPRSVVDTYSLDMQRHIEQAISDRHYDLVIASQWSMAGYGKCFQGLPSLFEEVELGVLYEKFKQSTSIWHHLRYGLTWFKHRHYLARLLQNYRACTVVSEQEKLSLARIAPGYKSIEVIPNCIDLASYRSTDGSPEPNTIIFTGSFRYHANHDAMVWFLEKVYPLIQAQVPDVQLTITGDHEEQSLPDANNVKLVGHVDDIQSLIKSSWVSIAPIRLGGGTRLKILEAMALRTPVVSTSKGAEGLQVQHGDNILIADTPEAFAECAVQLFKNPGLPNKLANNAYQLVSEKYDWSIAVPRFLNLIEKVSKNKYVN